MAIKFAGSQMAGYQDVLERVIAKNSQLMEQHAMDALVYGKGIIPTPMPKTPKQLAMMGEYNQKSPDEEFFIRLLGMRLRVQAGELIPFDHITCYHDKPSDSVHLIVIKNNQCITMKESGAIFPSDETIAQLNMIINK